jgi:hypothetical protein
VSTGERPGAGRVAAESPGSYPLTVPWVLLGVLVGMAVGVSADNLLPGYALATLIVSIGVTWRVADPPVIPFLLSYQWLSVTSGYWYQWGTGDFPGLYRPGDVESTMVIALTGLLLLAVGIRLVDQVLSAWARRRFGPAETEGAWAIGSLEPLFVLVLLGYSIDYIWVVNTKVFAGLDVALQRLLDLRQVLLVTLFWEVLRRRNGYVYLWAALLWSFVPKLGGYFSEFKSPLLLLLIAYGCTFRPWDPHWWPKSLMAFVKASPVVAVLVILLLVWQGGLKRDTREAFDAGYGGANPIARVTTFVEGVQRAVPDLFADPSPYVERLVERVSYITFFSLVLDHVPSRESHAEGELLWSAFANAVMPRVLFPEKPVLASDSTYTRRFAGVSVAEGATSISIGYMAEFYADWGFRGMWLSIFAYGCWIGLMAAVLRRFTPMPVLHVGVLTVVVLVVVDFEHQFIKGFAAINASVVFTLVMLFAIRPWLNRVLDVTGGPAEQPARLDVHASEAPDPSVIG